jgi:predicted O-methyltransferase YrrM
MMHGIRLAGEASPPVVLHAVRRSVPRGCEVVLTGAREEIGAGYSAAAGERRIDGTLESIDGRAGAVVYFEGDSSTGMCPGIAVDVSGREAASFPAIMSLKRVLERYVEALGGRNAMERIRSRRCLCESVTEPLKPDGDGKSGIPGSFSVTVDSLGRWLYGDLSSEPPVQRGFDGSSGWVLDGNGLRREDLSGWGVTVWWIDPRGPLRFDRYFSGLELVPPGAEDDGRYHEARGMLPGGREIRFLFDGDSGLLVHAGRLVFSDYRKAGDVMLPHLVYFDTRDSRTKFTIVEVETDIDLEEGMFEIPDPAVRFPDIFSGITDPKVLPMLKDLPAVHGGMNVPAADGRFLYDLIIERGYRRGLEIGTSNGYSALWMGLAFRETGGSLITIEYERLSGLEAKENFEKAGLDGVIDLRINDAFDEIPAIEGQFDFVFLDAWKPDYIRFLDLVRARVVPGGAIAAHNVVAQEHSMRDFLEAIENDPGLETSFIETSSEGISLSTVKN